MRSESAEQPDRIRLHRRRLHPFRTRRQHQPRRGTETSPVPPPSSSPATAVRAAGNATATASKPVSPPPRSAKAPASPPTTVARALPLPPAKAAPRTQLAAGNKAPRSTTATRAVATRSPTTVAAKRAGETTFVASRVPASAVPTARSRPPQRRCRSRVPPQSGPRTRIGSRAMPRRSAHAVGEPGRRHCAPVAGKGRSHFGRLQSGAPRRRVARCCAAASARPSSRRHALRSAVTNPLAELVASAPIVQVSPPVAAPIVPPAQPRHARVRSADRRWHRPAQLAAPIVEAPRRPRPRVIAEQPRSRASPGEIRDGDAYRAQASLDT